MKRCELQGGTLPQADDAARGDEVSNVIPPFRVRDFLVTLAEIHVYTRMSKGIA
jgi:hypothetical protein